MVLDLNKEMAWITFLNDGWETKWHPVTDDKGKHLKFDSVVTMGVCRTTFKDSSWGIAPTSQMILNNSVRDNL